MQSRSSCHRYSVAVLGFIIFLVLKVDAFVPHGRWSSSHTSISQRSVHGEKNDSQIEIGEDETVVSRKEFLKTLGAATVVAATTMGSSREAKAIDAKTSFESELMIVATASETVDWQGIVQKASKKALGGGKAGASAAVVQVFSLMWLRTAMNYQYRYGGNLFTSLDTLWAEGGISRLYQGLGFALVQGPSTRFFDTAANVGILALLESFDATASMPLPLKTACGSVAAGLSRIMLMPIDTSKTAMQVEGAEGLERLWTKVGKQGPGPLFQGAVASAAATTAGHFPWFSTYNALSANLPIVPDDDLFLSLLRSAFIGLSASCVSDCVSNGFRVLKTTKQTAGLGKEGESSEISYGEALALILEEGGVLGLLGRGLQTRLLTNMIQGAVFSVLWKYFQTAQGMP